MSWGNRGRGGDREGVFVRGLGVRDSLEHTCHFLSTGWVFDDQTTALQHHVHGINDLVERRCGAALLLEANETQIGLAAMLENSVELSSEGNFTKAEDCLMLVMFDSDVV